MAVISLLPAVGLSIFLLIQTISAGFSGSVEWNNNSYLWKTYLLMLVIPLLIVLGVAWFFNRKGHLTLGVCLGLAVLSIVYLAYGFALAYSIAVSREVYRDPTWGEDNYAAYAIRFGMFVISVLALLGLRYWFGRLHQRLPSIQ